MFSSRLPIEGRYAPYYVFCDLAHLSASAGDSTKGARYQPCLGTSPRWCLQTFGQPIRCRRNCGATASSWCVVVLVWSVPRLAMLRRRRIGRRTGEDRRSRSSAASFFPGPQPLSGAIPPRRRSRVVRVWTADNLGFGTSSSADVSVAPRRPLIQIESPTRGESLSSPGASHRARKRLGQLFRIYDENKAEAAACTSYTSTASWFLLKGR